MQRACKSCLAGSSNHGDSSCQDGDQDDDEEEEEEDEDAD